METPPAAKRGSTSVDAAAPVLLPDADGEPEPVRLPVMVALEFDPVAVTDPVCLAVVPVAAVLPVVAVCLAVVPVDAADDSVQGSHVSILLDEQLSAWRT